MGHVVERLRLPVPCAEDFVVPEADLPGAVESGADRDDRRGAERVEEELLGTVPDDLDRSPRQLRQAGGFDGLRAGALPAEAAADVRRDDVDLLRREAER